MATLKGPRAFAKRFSRPGYRTPNSIRLYATAPAAIEQNEPDLYIPDPSSPPLTPLRSDRKGAIRAAKPFSEFLTDTFHRQHDYLRISVTERCNLRCLYCMPEEGIELSPNKDILTSAEIYYLSALFVNQGVNKIRLTGGEPTVRKDIVPLMQQIGSLRRNGLKELALTTNAISLHRKLDAMVEAGLTGVNISLDTLDPFQFQLLTRRQGFDAVMKSINRVQEMNKLGAGVKLKINAVVMRGLNDHQILPFVEKTREEDIEVRFIEYMPFGGNKWSQNKMLPYSEMLDMIHATYPTFTRLKDAKNDTSKTWQVPGFKGRVGFITSMTHNFCGSCNRLRITSDGNLKVCLHGNAEVSLRDLLRQDNNGEPMDEAAFEAIRQLELDRRKGSEMRFDGDEGWMAKEQQLLEVIGAAVKRKKAKHAGMGALENMKNRPMILIGGMKNIAEETVLTPDTADSSPTPRTSAYTHHREKPWSRLPLHLLGPASYNRTQIRWSSSDSKRPTDDLRNPEIDGKGVETEEKQPSGLVSMFGFQSLSGLFRRSGPERYTGLSNNRNDDHSLAVDTKFAEPNIATTTTESSQVESQQQNAAAFPSSTTPDSKSPEKAEMSTIRKVAMESSVLDSDAQGRPLPYVRRFGVDGIDPSITRSGRVRAMRGLSKLPSSASSARVRGALVVEGDRAKPGPVRPWGLSSMDVGMMYSTEEPAQPPARRGETSTDITLPPDKQIEAKSNMAMTQQSSPVSDRLTHVNQSGEAHMVDVSAKTHTRRVAIACSTAIFTNLQPFKQISSNNNKKGDVLGVARIAGIMATKRTADLIPLCHPIPLTKVEVHVRLEAPSARQTLPGSKYGCVYIEAQVECVGPTGVEMEALTAANVAALTVLDMCKAVDKRIRIGFSNVLYKSGGRSGMYALDGWAVKTGRQFFIDRGLEVPMILEPKKGKR